MKSWFFKREYSEKLISAEMGKVEGYTSSSDLPPSSKVTK